MAICGYTNAGKSTLLNALTNGDALAADKLFATLDPISRRLRFPHEREVVITDTVGFIRDLPKDLRAAFAATLEEMADADLLLQLLARAFGAGHGALLAPAAHDPHDETPTQPAAALDILLVDDHRDFTELVKLAIETVFRTVSTHVATASSGEEALRKSRVAPANSFIEPMYFACT